VTDGRPRATWDQLNNSGAGRCRGKHQGFGRPGPRATVTSSLRHERRRRSHVGDPSDAVLCERWRIAGPPAPAHGGRR
jgi:hypothetical protein